MSSFFRFQFGRLDSFSLLKNVLSILFLQLLFVFVVLLPSYSGLLHVNIFLLLAQALPNFRGYFDGFGAEGKSFGLRYPLTLGSVE